jgi:CDP-diacylglycerol pyrophosphatase
MSADDARALPGRARKQALWFGGLMGAGWFRHSRCVDLEKRVERQKGTDGDQRTAGATSGRRPTTLLRPRMLWAVAICAPLLTGCAVLAQGAARDPNALWVIVHNVCVQDQQIFANPAPCAEVNLTDGYVILKDPNPSAPTHFLLIPTARVTGIEDPAILSPGAPNYWTQAWHARRYVDQRAGRVLGRDELSLAINSVYGRSQDQLHIHIDCIKPAVRAALRAHANAIGPNWAPFPVLLGGEPYLAKRIEGSDLDGVSLFQLLAALPETHAAMGELSLVVTGETGASGRPGFILLAGRSAPGSGNKWGEALQDHRCTLARSPERRVVNLTNVSHFARL